MAKTARLEVADSGHKSPGYTVPAHTSTLDMILHAVVSGITVDSPWMDTQEAHPNIVNDLVLTDEKEDRAYLEFFKVGSIFFNWLSPNLWKSTTRLKYIMGHLQVQ